VRPDRPSVTPGAPVRRGIYWLPNAITTAALFAGFFAIVQAMNGRFETAAMAIFVAGILDGLDGRIARWTRTQSAFGAEFDSLSDMVAFGVAPALVVYVWALGDFSAIGQSGERAHWLLGKLGWIAAFLYCACAALRLARFNTKIGVVDKRYFQGLPSPAAAALVVGFVWVMDDAGIKGAARIDWLAWGAFALTLYAGLTMVTNAPFYSFKDVSLKKSVPFVVIVVIALVIALINVHPPIVLFGMFLIYGASGYVLYAWRRMKGKPVSVIATSTEDPDEVGLHR